MEENKIKVDYTTDREKNNLSDTSSMPSSEIEKYLIWKPAIISIFLGVLLDGFQSIYFTLLVPVSVFLYTFTIYKLKLKSTFLILFLSVILFVFVVMGFSFVLLSNCNLFIGHSCSDMAGIGVILMYLPLSIIAGAILGLYLNRQVKRWNLFPEKKLTKEKPINSSRIVIILSILALIAILLYLYSIRVQREPYFPSI